MQTPQNWCAPRRTAPWLALPLLTAALWASGCSTLDVPHAENYPASGQKKARAVHHWDVLADDVAMRIADKISAWPAGEHPIYVVPAADTSFNQGFRKLLLTRLLDRGVFLSTEPTAVALAFDAQLVHHSAPVPHQALMPWTRLAPGIAVARDAAVPSSGPAAVVPGTPATATLNAWQPLAVSGGTTAGGAAAGGPTRTEVLIITSLEGGSRYLARTADVYYIVQDDALLYEVPPPPPPPPPPAPSKTWQVVVP